MTWNEEKQTANQAYGKGLYAEAIKRYTKCIQIFEVEKQIQQTLFSKIVGGILCRLEQEQDKYALCTEQDKLELSKLFANRSASNLQLLRDNDALLDALTSVNLAPLWPKAHLRLFNVYFEMDKLEESKKALTTLLELDPNLKQELEIKIQAMNHSNVRVFRLQPGRHICIESGFNPIRHATDFFAVQMKNIVYLIADLESRNAFLIDPCWDPEGILKFIQENEFNLQGCLLGHCHVDHIGGQPPPPFDSYRVKVPGLLILASKHYNLSKQKLKVYVHPLETTQIKMTEPEILSSNHIEIIYTEDNLEFKMNNLEFKFIHTPGHTPGSQCILVNGCMLMSSDTVFYNNCGRTDMPGGCSKSLRQSLLRLMQLDENIVIYPGHSYQQLVTTIRHEKRNWK